MSFSSWRGVVGMVNPTMRPGMTEEVCRLLPDGIGLIPLFLNISRGTQEEFKTMMPHYEKLVAVLAEQKCDVIHPNGAPPFMVHGFKGEAKIVAGWEKKYKTPIMSVAQNHVRALHAVKAKNFVGATYFPEKLNAIFAKYFTDAGFKVRSMVLPDAFIDHDTPAAMYAKAGLDAAGIVAKVFDVFGSRYEAPELQPAELAFLVDRVRQRRRLNGGMA